jgi:hypothetical protein
MEGNQQNAGLKQRKQESEPSWIKNTAAAEEDKQCTQL